MFLGSFGRFRDWFLLFFKDSSDCWIFLSFSLIFPRFFGSWLFLKSFVEFGDFSEFVRFLWIPFGVCGMFLINLWSFWNFFNVFGFVWVVRDLFRLFFKDSSDYWVILSFSKSFPWIFGSWYFLVSFVEFEDFSDYLRFLWIIFGVYGMFLINLWTFWKLINIFLFMSVRSRYVWIILRDFCRTWRLYWIFWCFHESF